MQKEKRQKIFGSTLILITSPFIGEGLSTSSPFLEFIQPINFILLVMLYGFGALIVRELTIRWKQNGFALITLVLLGIAYGCIEEGLYLFSFFNPNWHDLDNFQGYGRFYGVNWVWTIYLALFHMVYSIIIPIVFAQSAFPTIQEKKWLPNYLFIPMIIIFILGGGIWFFYVYKEFQYLPGITEYLGCLFVTIALIISAWLIPEKNSKFPSEKSSKQRNQQIEEINNTNNNYSDEPLSQDNYSPIRHRTNAFAILHLFVSFIWAVVFFFSAFLFPSYNSPFYIPIIVQLITTILWLLLLKFSLIKTRDRVKIILFAMTGAYAFLYLFNIVVGEILSKFVYGFLGFVLVIVIFLVRRKKQKIDIVK
ncbi:MAG: hypothetical protein GF308_10810 [Candidatus Heimdallarchaeota archaeon]|nr:hypothetical protein [Candidatus Heimdallarchaeota archaeon]